MKMTPLTRSILLSSNAFSLFCAITISWIFLRLSLIDAQRIDLAPSQFSLEVITAEDYRRISEAAPQEVTLSDGTRFTKAPAWYTTVLPNYARTPDGSHYVLVALNSTRFMLPYVEPYIGIFAVLTAYMCGLSLWNQRRVRKEFESTNASFCEN